METKDWIIMLVPIIVNGAVLFFFQQSVTYRVNQLVKKMDYRQEIYKEFLNLLKDFYEKFRMIRDWGQPTSQGKVEFSTAWNMATEQIQKVLIYYDTHKTTLNRLEKSYSSCIEKYQCMINILKDETISRGEEYIVTEKCSIDFCNEYWEMDKAIKECLDQCEKHIVDMR